MKEVLCVLAIFVTATRTSDSCIIENIVISVDTSGKDVVASWTYDTTCANMRYLLVHTIDGVPVNHGAVSNGVTLEKRICSTNELEVTVRNAQGIQNVATKEFVVGQNNPVENLLYDGGRFEWGPPIGAETCTVTYDVVWENQADIQEDNIHQTYFEVNLLPCRNKITVTPVVLETRGPSLESVKTITPEDLGPVRDIIFNNGRFEWNPPIDTETCTVTYDVVLENQAGIDETSIHETYFAANLLPCRNRITVTPVVLDRRGPLEESEGTITPEDLGPVRDLIFNNGRFEWNPPIDTETCSVTYDVVLENQAEIDENNIHETYFAVNLMPCRNRITVTPVVLDRRGPLEEIEETITPEDLGPVRDLLFNNGRFEWNPPIDTGTCSVTYDVVLENQAGIDENNIHETYFAVTLLPCRNRITVTPVVLDRHGPLEESEEMVTPEDLGPVRDLLFNNGRFEWNPPIDTGTCSVTYDVVLENQAGIDENNIHETYFPVNLLPCKNRITVTPVVLDRRGPLEEIDETITPEDVGPVRDLQFNEDRFEWKQPYNTLTCAVTYVVRFQNALGVNDVHDIELEYFVFDLHPCTWNNIEVTPIVLAATGEARQHSHTIRPQMNAPVHVFTEPDTSGAVAVWRLDRPAGNVCEIRGFVATVSPTATYYGTFDDASETGTVTTSDLIERERYTYSTQWILDDAVLSEPSLSITFLAEPLSPPNIAVEPITANGFTISWEQDIDMEFIQGYRVVITPNGPLHFLPEGCDQDETVRSYDINDNSEYQYDFSDGQPSFKYTVELFRIFTLGLERSAVATIETLETAPGKLTISPQLEYENGVRYVASANIVWPVPCDVNGFIQNFTYTITGNMNFANRENCQMIELNGVVTEMDYENTYSIRVNDLLPFLRYTLDVTTNLRHHSHTTTDTFDPPEIYTPP